MSNLQSAKDALQAELSQAKAGMAYYQSRAEAIEKTLAQLADLNVSDDSGASRKRGRGLAVRGSRPRKGGALRGVRRMSSASDMAEDKRGELPFTGGDYWINLLSDQPQSGPEVLRAAINKLSFVPTRDQIQKLAGRMTFALNTMVKDKKIQDSGSGRARKFFRA